MKKSEITLGKRYAVRYKGDVVPADLIRPQRGGWIVVRVSGEEYETPTERTLWVRSADILAPWDSYCIDAAHQSALIEDETRDLRERYEAEWTRREREWTPLCEALLGIEVRVEDEDRDLGKWLHDRFLGDRTSGVLVGFDVFAAVARALIEAREAAMNAGGGWGPGPTDTGIAVPDGPSIGALQRFANGE